MSCLVLINADVFYSEKIGEWMELNRDKFSDVGNAIKDLHDPTSYRPELPSNNRSHKYE